MAVIKQSQKRLGAHIKGARVVLKLSQDVLAQALGVSRESLCRIEKGRGRVDSVTLCALSLLLKVEVQSLLAADVLQAVAEEMAGVTKQSHTAAPVVVEEAEVEDDLDDAFYDRVNATLVAMKEDK